MVQMRSLILKHYLSPKIQNQENCKNVVNNVLLYLGRSVTDQWIRWKLVFTLLSHLSTTTIPGKGQVTREDIAFWSEYCILMPCGRIYCSGVKVSTKFGINTYRYFQIISIPVSILLWLSKIALNESCTKLNSLQKLSAGISLSPPGEEMGVPSICLFLNYTLD